MIKLLVGALLALTAANSIAGNMYIYKEKGGQVLLTNVNPSGNFDKFTKDVKVTYYKDGSSAHATYASSAYDALYGSPQTSTPEKSVQKVIKPMKKAEIINTDIKQSSLSFEVPDGYRLPTKSDITGDWKRFNGPNHLKADFNGDGIEDEAYLLPKEGSKLGYGVFVSLNKSKAAIQSGRDFQMFKLTGRDDMQPQSFAIELAEPSDEVWKSACGKGYWECEIGEPSAFKINQPSIMFCYIESACTIYMWDSKKLTFKEIQFSD